MHGCTVYVGLAQACPNEQLKINYHLMVYYHSNYIIKQHPLLYYTSILERNNQTTIHKHKIKSKFC